MAKFHVRTDETINKTIRMKISMIEEITTLAEQHGISFNQLVVQMCQFALENLPDKSDD